MKIYSEGYGCPSNIANHEAALGLLERAGFEITHSPKESDLNLIFTCVVKTPSSQRMIHKIKKLTAIGKPLIVAGCMPRIEQKTIEKISPAASMLGPVAIEKVVDVVKKTLSGEKVIFVSDLRKPKRSLPRVRKNKNVGIITISSGCNQLCSYCCVKFARGKLFSYPVDGIVAEVKQAIKDGCNELWLTSQDNSSYNFDGIKLPQLLNEICKIPGDFKIRVGMMNPAYVKNEKLLSRLVEAYKNEKVMKFLHLPVQSGSDRILRVMKRGYVVAEFKKIVERFRKEIPDLFLSTDVIVGFPTEDSSDFNLTLKLIKNLKFNKVNISKFGSRPSTLASKMKQLKPKIINQRSKILHEVVKNIQSEIKKKNRKNF